MHSSIIQSDSSGRCRTPEGRNSNKTWGWPELIPRLSFTCFGSVLFYKHNVSEVDPPVPGPWHVDAVRCSEWLFCSWKSITWYEIRVVVIQCPLHRGGNRRYVIARISRLSSLLQATARCHWFGLMRMQYDYPNNCYPGRGHDHRRHAMNSTRRNGTTLLLMGTSVLFYDLKASPVSSRAPFSYIDHFNRSYGLKRYQPQLSVSGWCANNGQGVQLLLPDFTMSLASVVRRAVLRCTMLLHYPSLIRSSARVCREMSRSFPR
ncbi:hypothetical protein GGR57DRAFT_164928 [Xylariaceae sp. FL1272]|nr:hypothetical protein GGR57DRAFT_164928 [Xylariaceae sp. FL1272]